MSMLGLFSFPDHEPECSASWYNVYVSSDCYPEGAAAKIRAALPYALPLPKFYASDFAAAFVAANKPLGGGGVYLEPSDDPTRIVDGTTIQYRYEISLDSGQNLFVRAYTPYGMIFEGTIDAFEQWAPSRPEAIIML